MKMSAVNRFAFLKTLGIRLVVIAGLVLAVRVSILITGPMHSTFSYEGAAHAAPKNYCGGDCRSHCLELCERCKGKGADIGHYCSDGGEGWKACMAITEGQNDRCHDRDWLSQCGSPTCASEPAKTSPKKAVTYVFVNQSGRTLHIFSLVSNAKQVDCKTLVSSGSMAPNAQWNSEIPVNTFGWYRFQTTSGGGCDSRFNKYEAHKVWRADTEGKTIKEDVL